MRFNLDNYAHNSKYCMHCNTEEKANIFLSKLHSSNRRWIDGSPYINNIGEARSYFSDYRENTVYYFNEGTYCDIEHANRIESIILEFDDFDWEEFQIVDEFDYNLIPAFDEIL